MSYGWAKDAEAVARQDTTDADLAATVLALAAIVYAGASSAGRTVRIAGRTYLIGVEPSATDVAWNRYGRGLDGHVAVTDPAGQP